MKPTRVYISGVFDLLHVGHIRAIQAAREAGNAHTYLIVGVTSDQSVSEYKRNSVIPYAERCEMISAIKGIDQVIEAPNYPDIEFYRYHQIDLHIQGAEHPNHKFYEAAKTLGIIRFVGRQDITSSSEIIQRILERGDSLRATL